MNTLMDITKRHELEEQFYDFFFQFSSELKDTKGFIDFLTNDTAFFNGPFSVIGPYNYSGGLLEYSINFTRKLIDVNYFILNIQFTLKECLIRGLFSSFNKAYVNGHFPFILMVEDEGERWAHNPELVFLGDPYKEVYKFTKNLKHMMHPKMFSMLRFVNDLVIYDAPLVDYNNEELCLE